MWFRDKATLSELTERVLAPQRDVTGFANADDAMHFSMVLAYQRHIGVRGDLFEIGTYFGKSTMVLAYHMRSDETLVVCDAFEKETVDQYAEKPRVSDVLSAIRQAVPDFSDERLEVHDCLSDQLVLEDRHQFRFAHIDGGHSIEECLHDLELVAPHVVEGGVIAVDDYAHPRWPGVKEACDEFLSRSAAFAVFADMNRWVATGRKLYLVRGTTA